MDYGHLDTEWFLTENKIVQPLQPIKRAAIKNYLNDSVCPYTLTERSDHIIEEYIKDIGYEAYAAKLKEKIKKDPLYTEKQFRYIIEIVYEEDHDDPTFCNSILDNYDYSSQRLALELLERFNNYRQIISCVTEIDSSSFLEWSKGKEPEGYYIEVDFIDKNNIGQYQVRFEIKEKILDSNILNINAIQLIEAIKKIPKISIFNFNKLPKSQLQIRYFPEHNIGIHKFQCFNHKTGIIKDKFGHEFELTISDGGYVLFDSSNMPYRCLPIFEMLEHRIKKMDFSKCKDRYISDYKAVGISNARYGDPNALKHYFDKESSTIFFQIYGQDRTNRSRYYYITYDVLINFKNETQVTVKENQISYEDFHEPIDEN